jgi:transposase
LGLARETVHKYQQWAVRHSFLTLGTPFPDDAALAAALGEAPKLPTEPSSVEPYHARVQELLAQGVEMTAIFARLRDNYGYRGSYSSVRRFVAHLAPPEAKVVVRVHSAPGEEAQVDFGGVGELVDPRDRRLRTASIFVATLCYSRHMHAELVFDQKVATWIALHRHTFEAWGGVPQRIVPDNLKAAVARHLIDGPVLGEAYRRMALHYDFLVSPTRPGTPQHKGKVENGVHYVQRNFMAGQAFADIDIATHRLKVWIREVAGARLHGTTHQAPWRMFEEQERAALRPLPAEPFTLCEVRPVKVHPDCHVTLNGSYYSVPYAYVPGGSLDKGGHLDAYISERVVEIYDGLKLVATHLRAHSAGEWHTRLEHYPREKALYLERTPQRCREMAAQIGPATSQVVVSLLDQRPLDRLRSVQGILRLQESVGALRLEAACRRALYFGDATYRRIKEILNAALDREPLPESTEASAAPAHQKFAFARPAAEFFQPALEQERPC